MKTRTHKPFTQKSYTCPYCPEQFRYSYNLKVHITNMHKIEKVKAPPKAETWVCYSKKKKILISELSQEDSNVEVVSQVDSEKALNNEW